MADDSFEAHLDVALHDLQLAIGDAVATAADLIPAKRLEHFKSKTATAQAALDKLLDGKAREIQSRWQTYESAVARHLESQPKDPVERLLEYMQLRDLRGEMAGMESKDVRQLIADGIQSGDDRYLRAAGMGLKPLASPDFIQAQHDQHVDNRLRSTEQGSRLADGRAKLEAMQEAIGSVSFRARRQAARLIDDGAKKAVNPPPAEPTIERSYQDYKREQDARQAIKDIAQVQ